MSKGLANLGNTCSINALVQCIGHCDYLRDYFLHKSSFQKKDENTFSIGQELSLILKQLWVDQNALKPIRFLKALQETMGSDAYSIGQEQLDFTEVWMVLIQRLLEESHELSFQSNMFQKGPYVNEINQYIYTKAIHEWEKQSKDTNSPLLDVVQGVHVQQIECTHCHRFYHNVEPFQSTYLDLPNQESTSIQECLHQYLQIDQVDGWKCDQCHQSKNEKVMRFWKLPNVWIFLLKRFHGMKKNHIKVYCPKTLHIPEHFEMGGSSCEYQLKSMAQHYGSIHGGHYNAICHHQDSWFLYDDVHIQEISSNDFLNNPYVYALFYERVS